MSTTLAMTVQMKITPKEGQTPEEAREELFRHFQDYLTDPDSPFMTDYGPDAWGGYDGATVEDVEVEETFYDFDTVVAMLDTHPAFVESFITSGHLPSEGKTLDTVRVRHDDLMVFKKAREEGRRIVDEALAGKTEQPLQLTDAELEELDEL